MAFSIPSVLMTHIDKIDVTFDLSSLSDKQRTMLRNYLKNGVIRTGGIAGLIARHFRIADNKQVIIIKNSRVTGRNIVDADVHERIVAALTLSKIDNASRSNGRRYYREDPYIQIYREGGEDTRGATPEQFLAEKPKDFYLYMDNLDKHLKISKLSDVCEYDIDQPITVDMRKFNRYM